MLCMDDIDENGKPVNMNLFGHGVDVPHRYFEIVYKPLRQIRKSKKIALRKHLKFLKDWLSEPELVLIFNE